MASNLADESPLDIVSWESCRKRIDSGIANLFVKVHSRITSARLRRKAKESVLPVEIRFIFYEDLARLRNDPDLAPKSAYAPRFM